MTVYHIPVCPFSQRVEILARLKGVSLDFHVVDITKPRPEWLLARTRGTTALPVLETEDGRILKESLVLLRYLEDRFPERPVQAVDPYLRAVEGMMVALEGDFTAAGYRLLMNQDPGLRESLHEAMRAQFRKLDDFLTVHGGEGPWLLDDFGMAETVFTPMLMRFWFLEYYEGFVVPPDLARVARWREACLAHPAAQQVTREEIVKLYYDYSRGAGNGALPPGRSVSSFAFEPPWSGRPWPPADKYGPGATDAELGLLEG